MNDSRSATSRTRNESAVAGAIMVALGAVCFASKEIFAKHLYALGVTPDVLVTWRAFLALPVFWAWGLYRARSALFEVPRGALLAATFAGIMCYCFGSMMDFIALTLIDVSVERVLLFSYPAIVVLFTSMLTRQRPSGAVILAVVLTYGGILLVVSGWTSVCCAPMRAARCSCSLARSLTRFIS